MAGRVGVAGRGPRAGESRIDTLDELEIARYSVGNWHPRRGGSVRPGRKGGRAMPDLDAMIRAKSAVEPQLLSQPGVTGVGVGLREKGGKLTEEVVIRVYVERKRPLGEVP